MSRPAKKTPKGIDFYAKGRAIIDQATKDPAFYQRLYDAGQERGAVCTILNDWSYYHKTDLGSEEFVDPVCREIYEVAGEMIEAKLQPDVLTVTAYLRERGRLRKDFDAWEITDVGVSGHVPSMFEVYCHNIRAYYLDRKMVEALTGGVMDIIGHQRNREEILTDLRQHLYGVASPHITKSEVTDAAFEELFKDIEEREHPNPDKPLGLLTGIPSWDAGTSGIFKSEMHILASRPGVGKTAALETLIQTHMERGIHHLVFQKDMSIGAMIGRMAARKAELTYERYKTGLLHPEELARFRKSASELRALKQYLHIYNPDKMTVEDLETIVRLESSKHELGAWSLDHFFQLSLKTHGGEHLTEAASDASRVIRRVINETGIPGIVLVHINREGEKAGRPKGIHLKYCDQLYGDCDACHILSSDQDPKELAPHARQEVIWTIEKSRCGAVGDDTMNFHREHMTFEEI